MVVCATCKRRRRLTYGYCADCFEFAVKTRGELALIVEHYKRWRYEEFVQDQPDTVYCHFHRISKDANGLYRPHLDDRQWCIELKYESGFPSPPLLRFVNPYNYQHTDPVYWPDMTIPVDCIREVIDAPNIHPKSAYVINPDLDVDPKKLQPHCYVDYVAERILPRQWP